MKSFADLNAGDLVQKGPGNQVPAVFQTEKL